MASFVFGRPAGRSREKVVATRYGRTVRRWVRDTRSRRGRRRHRGDGGRRPSTTSRRSPGPAGRFLLPLYRRWYRLDVRLGQLAFRRHVAVARPQALQGHTHSSSYVLAQRIKNLGVTSGQTCAMIYLKAAGFSG
jgi:hypothetical protein